MISIDNFRLQNETASAAAPSETPNRYQHKCQKHRTTSLISFKTLKNSIKSSWRFECESAEPNTPTKSTQMSVLKQKPVVLPDGNNWLTSAQDDLGEARGTRRPQPANPRSLTEFFAFWTRTRSGGSVALRYRNHRKSARTWSTRAKLLQWVSSG